MDAATVVQEKRGLAIQKAFLLAESSFLTTTTRRATTDSELIDAHVLYAQVTICRPHDPISTRREYHAAPQRISATRRVLTLGAVWRGAGLTGRSQRRRTSKSVIAANLFIDIWLGKVIVIRGCQAR